MSLSLSINKLSCQVQDTTLLSDISLSVLPGTITGIIGPNGAGKSTILKILAGVLPFQSGDIQLDDKPLSQWTPQALAQTIGYLPQHTPVTWPLCVEQVVALGRLPYSANKQFTETDLLAIDAAIKDCGLELLRERAITNLSAGELALVNIARVMATQTKIILADEPAAALDPHHQLTLMEVFAARKKAGTTTLVVLHDLALAARWCDQIILVNAGNIISSGTTDEVLTAENLQQCYNVDVNFINGQLSVLPEYLRRSKL